jgi:hypothetical protein
MEKSKIVLCLQNSGSHFLPQKSIRIEHNKTADNPKSFKQHSIIPREEKMARHLLPRQEAESVIREDSYELDAAEGDPSKCFFGEVRLRFLELKIRDIYCCDAGKDMGGLS